jgi:cbb3-type cytochrome oxidase maturation protein
MEVLAILIPVSLGLGILGLLAFVWSMRSRQYDDPDGDSARILRDDYDDAPAPDTPAPPEDSDRP